MLRILKIVYCFLRSRSLIKTEITFSFVILNKNISCLVAIRIYVFIRDSLELVGIEDYTSQDTCGVLLNNEVYFFQYVHI